MYVLTHYSVVLYKLQVGLLKGDDSNPTVNNKQT